MSPKFCDNIIYYYSTWKGEYEGTTQEGRKYCLPFQSNLVQIKIIGWLCCHCHILQIHSDLVETHSDSTLLSSIVRFLRWNARTSKSSNSLTSIMISWLSEFVTLAIFSPIMKKLLQSAIKIIAQASTSNLTRSFRYLSCTTINRDTWASTIKRRKRLMTIWLEDGRCHRQGLEGLHYQVHFRWCQCGVASNCHGSIEWYENHS